MRAATHEHQRNPMKTIKHIKEKVTDFDNLRSAYFNARKNKRYTGLKLRLQGKVG